MRIAMAILSIHHVSLVYCTFKCFRPMFTCDNKTGCAMDEPTVILEKVVNKILCTYECWRREDCVSFNYLETLRSCQLFSSTPYKIWKLTNCTGYDNIDGGGNLDRLPQPGENLARHRRSCQSTTFREDGFSYWSWLAVDDVLGTNPFKAECSATALDDQHDNWFMVDLVRFVTTGYVRVLISWMNPAYRYKNLTIGITNRSWLVESPVRGKYPLCGVNLGAAPNVTWVQINCRPRMLPSRYIVVHQVPVSYYYGGFLPLCEVQVYGNVSYT